MLMNRAVILVRKMNEQGKSYNWTTPGGKLLEKPSVTGAFTVRESDLEGLERILRRDFLDVEIKGIVPYKEVKYSAIAGVPSMNKFYFVEMNGVNPNYQRLNSARLFTSTHHVNLSPLSIELITSLKTDKYLDF